MRQCLSLEAKFLEVTFAFKGAKPCQNLIKPLLLTMLVCARTERVSWANASLLGRMGKRGLVSNFVGSKDQAALLGLLGLLCQ